MAISVACFFPDQKVFLTFYVCSLVGFPEILAVVLFLALPKECLMLAFIFWAFCVKYWRQKPVIFLVLYFQCECLFARFLLMSFISEMQSSVGDTVTSLRKGCILHTKHTLSGFSHIIEVVSFCIFLEWSFMHLIFKTEKVVDISEDVKEEVFMLFCLWCAILEDTC